MGKDPPFHRRLVGHPRILFGGGIEKAARALLRAALIRDCQLPGSAAIDVINEQLIGCIGGERKNRRGEKLRGGRRRSWHLHRPYEPMEVAPWPKSMISAEA